MIRFIAPACLLPLPVLADVPHVMTDIAPIHSLTAQVMGELGTPDLLLPPGADPHDFALRPSDAANLGKADIVIWVGKELTPWLTEPLGTLAETAHHISLLDVDGWTKLDIRKAGHHAPEPNEDGHDDDHGHDDHDNHDDTQDHDDQVHAHGDFDPHAWADPQVAQVWVAAIASALAAADPENAATYAANAQDTIAELASLDVEITESLQGLADRAYVLPHDGYQYFETRYGLTAQAAIAGIDARTPGPAQIAAIRAQMAEQNVVCVFRDAEIGDRWATLITEGTAARTAQLDAVGTGLTAGPSLYPQMMVRLTNSFISCLDGDS